MVIEKESSVYEDINEPPLFKRLDHGRPNKF